MARQMERLENLLDTLDYEKDKVLYIKVSTMLMELNAKNLD